MAEQSLLAVGAGDGGQIRAEVHSVHEGVGDIGHRENGGGNIDDRDDVMLHSVGGNGQLLLERC